MGLAARSPSAELTQRSCHAQVMVVLYDGDPSRMRSDAVELSTRLAIIAGATTFAFFCSGYFNGEAGASLTAKLRQRGFGALLRRDARSTKTDSRLPRG